MVRSLLAAATVGPLVSACKNIYPTVAVAPGPGRSAADFDADRAACSGLVQARVTPMSAQLNANLSRTLSQMEADNARLQQAVDTVFSDCMRQRGNAVEGRPPQPSNAIPSVTPVASTQTGAAVARPSLGDFQDPRGSSLQDQPSEEAKKLIYPELVAMQKNCPGAALVLSAYDAPISSSFPARVVTLTQTKGPCLGSVGENDYLVVKGPDGWSRILEAVEGVMEVQRSSHSGYADVMVSGHGMCHRTYSWNGSQYKLTNVNPECTLR